MVSAEINSVTDDGVFDYIRLPSDEAQYDDEVETTDGLDMTLLLDPLSDLPPCSLSSDEAHSQKNSIIDVIVEGVKAHLELESVRTVDSERTPDLSNLVDPWIENSITEVSWVAQFPTDPERIEKSVVVNSDTELIMKTMERIQPLAPQWYSSQIQRNHVSVSSIERHSSFDNIDSLVRLLLID